MGTNGVEPSVIRAWVCELLSPSVAFQPGDNPCVLAEATIVKRLRTAGLRPSAAVDLGKALKQLTVRPGFLAPPLPDVAAMLGQTRAPRVLICSIDFAIHWLAFALLQTGGRPCPQLLLRVWS